LPERAVARRALLSLLARARAPRYMQRMPRRAWSVVRAAIGPVLVVAAVYAIARCRGRDRPGVVQAIIAVDRDTAIVLRDDRARRERGYVERVGGEAALGWRASIARPRRRPIAPLDAAGLTVGEGVVTVETEARRTPDVAGFRLADGAAVWHALPGARRYDVEGGTSFYNPLSGPLGDAGLLVGFYGKVERWNEAVAFDRATGAERWRAVLGPAVTGPAWLAPHHVVIRQLHETIALDRQTGQLQRFRTDLGACLVGDALYYVAKGALRVRRIGDDRDAAVPIDLGAALRVFGLCGRRGHLVILALAVGSEQHGPGAILVSYAPLRLVALDQATLALRWQLDLGPVALAGGDGGFRSTALGDQLGPLVPLRLMPAGTEAKPVLAIVDVDHGREVGRTAPAEDLLHLDLIRGPDRVYIVDDAAGISRLAALDATTGAITGALEVPHHLMLRAAHQAVSGRLWIGIESDVRVLDAATLRAVDGGEALPDSPSLRALLRH